MNDLRFGHVHQWCMDAERLPLDAGLGSDVGQFLELLDERRSTIRIARVVHRVRADEDVAGPAHLRQTQGEAQEDGVAGRHVGDRNAIPSHLAIRRRIRLGDVDVRGQRRATDAAQIDRRGDVVANAQ